MSHLWERGDDDVDGASGVSDSSGADGLGVVAGGVGGAAAVALAGHGGVAHEGEEFVQGAPHDFFRAHDFLEALRMMAHEQEEADFQDALRQSADEAYSGGFDAPPANESALEATTTTFIHKACDETSKCAVCLMEYEP